MNTQERDAQEIGLDLNAGYLTEQAKSYVP